MAEIGGKGELSCDDMDTKRLEKLVSYLWKNGLLHHMKERSPGVHIMSSPSSGHQIVCMHGETFRAALDSLEDERDSEILNRAAREPPFTHARSTG